LSHDILLIGSASEDRRTSAGAQEKKGGRPDTGHLYPALRKLSEREPQIRGD
jgi:hypothetical protein